jgi:hypothetical protein
MDMGRKQLIRAERRLAIAERRMALVERKVWLGLAVASFIATVVFAALSMKAGVAGGGSSTVAALAARFVRSGLSSERDGR